MMRRLLISALFVLCPLMVAEAVEKKPQLHGTAYTENAVNEVRIQVWALGEQVAKHPDWEFTAVFDGVVAPGKEFAVDLGEARLPVLVELAAEGHVAVALEVVLAEQMRLDPAWLRRGEPLTIRVTRGGRSATGARVWAWVDPEARSRDPRRWRPAIPRSVVPERGVVKAWVPEVESRISVQGLTKDHEFGEEVVTPNSGSTPTLKIDSVAVEVRVSDRRGRPAPGVAVIESSSPAAVASVTDDDGRAVVQIPGRGQWTLMALSDGAMGRKLGHSIPRDVIDLEVEDRAEIQFDWEPDLDPLVLRMSDLPAALGGGQQRASGGSMRFPAVVADTGWCEFWGPTVGLDFRKFEDATKPIALNASAEFRLDGRVEAPEGVAVDGLPVWVRSNAWMVRRMPQLRQRIDIPLVRPWLPWAVTDGRGRFSVTGLFSADYQVEVRAPGLPAAIGDHLTGEPGGRLETVIRLVQGATLSLTVTGPDEVPLEGAITKVFRSAREGTSLQARSRLADAREPEVTASTDGEGQLVIASVPVGMVRLEVSRPGSVTRTLRQIEVGPDGLDLGNVVLSPGVTVHGTTVGPDGKDVGGAEVAMARSPIGERFETTTVSDTDGRFSIADLDPTGEVFLRARADGMVPGAPLKVEMPPDGEIAVKMSDERVIEGTVLGGGDETPVPDAVVTASADLGRSFSGGGRTTSDDNGEFRIDGLAEGSYQLEATAPGWRRARQVVSVAPDEDPESMIIRLEKGHEIRGRVETSSGDPAPGLEVDAVQTTSNVAGRMRSWESSSTRSSEDGDFHFDDLGPGRHRLMVESQDGQSAEAIAVAGQAEIVVLRLEAGEVLDGVVVSDAGAPIAGAALMAFSEGGPRLPAAAESGADGTFRFENIRVGKNTVFAEAEGYVRNSEEVEVVAGSGADVEIRLQPGAKVVGEVRGLNSSELEQCRVYGGGANSRPTGDGSFTITGVEPGEQAVRASLRPAGRTREVRVMIPESGTSEYVVIDFAGGIAVTGRVLRGGHGVPGLTVSATRVGERVRVASVSGADGVYRLDGLNPGEYEIVALSRAGEVVAGDHLLLETDTEFDLIVEGGRLSGWVLEEGTEKPIEGAMIEITGTGLPAVLRTVATDASGGFLVDDLGDGEYRVAADASGHSPEQKSVSLRDSVPGSVTLHLGPLETTVLVVQTASGSPASSVAVLTSQGGVLGPTLRVDCGGEGRCEVSDLPRGVWTLFLRGDGVALLSVSLPAGEVPVTLRPRGDLVIRPTAETTGALWNVRVSEMSSGLVVPTTEWRNPGRGEWMPVRASGSTLWVPVGGWRIEAAAPDGTISVHEVTIAAGGTTEVMLE